MTRSTDLLWERWEEIDLILDRALEHPDADRAAFIRRAAGADTELGDLVLRLAARLDSDGQRRVTGPDESMVAAAFGVTGDGDESSQDLAAGTEIGRYVIVRRRARGGMATVYEADRSDGVYRQRVAIKVLRRGIDTEDLVRRFRRERQILSSLSHPHIARLLDGGATPEGRPFLVMELVEGEPVTRYADSAQLDLRARLDLFLGVADAVHAAHRQLVVHRDIKPSNILVGPDGRAKLLDFGIARLLEGDREHTEGGLRALTPDYASPEQLRGEPITTASDIYQLGLLLRELLTGVRPLAGDTEPGEPPLRPSRAAVEPVRNADPPELRAAARSTTPARLARWLRGDLDTIVGTALRPEPGQRYASADELAADVRRYLRGLPILAHPESTGYRIGKLIRRNRWSAAAALLSVMLLIGYAVTVTLQGRRIAAAGARAEQEAQTAERVTEFLVGLFRSADPTVVLSDTVTVLGILEEGAGRIDTALADQPAVQARMLLATGRAFTGLGRYDRADSLLARSLQLERRLHGPDHPRVADVLRFLGNNFRSRRDFAAADRMYQEELRIRAAIGPVNDTATVLALESLSITRRDLGDVDSAVALIHRAVQIRRSAGDTTSPEYVEALGKLGYVLRAAGALDSAERTYREVLRRTIARVGPDDNSLAAAYNNLGFLLRTRGNYAGAEREYREAVRIATKTLGEGHPTSLMLSSNLAGALILAGRFDEVEGMLRQHVPAARDQWPDGHRRVGSAHEALGRFLLRRSRPADAIAALRAAIASYTATIGADHAWTATARTWYGTALLLTGRGAEADRELASAHDILRAGRANLDGNTRFRVGQAAEVLDNHGHPARAAHLRKLLAPVDTAGGN